MRASRLQELQASIRTAYCALAEFKRAMASSLSFNSAAFINEFSCSMLVALAIGAVMDGLAWSHAIAILACVTWYSFATS